MSISRRQALSGAAATSLGATLASATPAKSSVVSEADLPLPELPKANSLGGNFEAIVESLHDAVSLNAEGGEKATSSIPQIAQPIDVGADEYLKDLIGDPLIYRPLEVEVLSSALNQHVSECLKLRHQAQELEVDALDERLRLISSERLNELDEFEAELARIAGPETLGSLFRPKQSDDGSLSSTLPDDPAKSIFSLMEKTALEAIRVSREELEAKKEFMTTPGSGSNHVEKFQFLRQLFELEMREAYSRARSLDAGLRHLFEKEAERWLPALGSITKTGYLDHLALWARKATILLERASNRREVSSLVIPLRQPFHLPKGVTIKDDINHEQFRKTGRLQLSVTLEAVVHNQLNLGTNCNPRVKGVSLGYAPNYEKENVVSLTSATRAVVLGPEFEVTPTDSNVGTRHRPRKSFAAIRQNFDDIVDFRYDPQFYNTNLTGGWVVEFETKDLFGQELHDGAGLDALYKMFLVIHFEHDT